MYVFFSWKRAWNFYLFDGSLALQAQWLLGETLAFNITLDNKFQNIFCICDEYVINLFVCVYEVRKGT
jgi:hypothetical protein